MGPSPGMSEAFPKPHQLVVQSRSPCQTPQLCGFAGARCAQRVSPKTPVPKPRGPCRTLSLTAVFPFAAVAVLLAEPGIWQLFGESRQPLLSITP